MSVRHRRWQRLADEIAQAWAIAVKDVRVYYLTPPMIMFGLLLPFFLFFSFSVRRGGSPEAGVARLLAMNAFFTASSAGPVVIPMERRVRTYDRLLAAPMSLLTLLLGKMAVGTFFALAVSSVSLLVAALWLGVPLAHPGLLVIGMILASVASAAFGLVFASVPAQSVGSIMMPSTLIRWPLLFISGIFVPLEEMSIWVRPLSYVSPLSYAQDLINRAVFGTGYFATWLGIVLLPVFTVIFLFIAKKLHDRSRVLGY